MIKINELFLIITISVGFIYFGYAINSCGVDNSGTVIVPEGPAKIETYPWLGLLFYPVGIHDSLVTTTIVLITRQMSLATALDIDKYPKANFRALARVVLGNNCSGPYINVKDYTFHPDFSKTTYSTLAIVQLDTLFVTHVIHPICPPPAHVRKPKVYAMTLTQDCTSSMVRVYKMMYVHPSECKKFYRRADLDMASLWPTHVTCARATQGGECVWRGGTILVMKDKDHWRLLGIGVYGPGCEAPARFLDYGMHHEWVRRSLAKIGRPAITRIGPDHLILRRTMDSVQRFGSCDPEETKAELFTDESFIGPKPADPLSESLVKYNLSLITNVDYSCIVLRVYNSDLSVPNQPSIRLRRWCTNPYPICFDFSILQVDFAVEIKFYSTVKYKVSAYGREIKLINIRDYRKYVNNLFYGYGIGVPAIDPKYQYSHDKFTASSSWSDLKFKQHPQKSGLNNLIIQRRFLYGAELGNVDEEKGRC